MVNADFQYDFVESPTIDNRQSAILNPLLANHERLKNRRRVAYVPEVRSATISQSISASGRHGFAVNGQVVSAGEFSFADGRRIGEGRST